MPVVALCQFNRTAGLASILGLLSHLKESSGTEQNASTIIYVQIEKSEVPQDWRLARFRILGSEPASKPIDVFSVDDDIRLRTVPFCPGFPAQGFTFLSAISFLFFRFAKGNGLSNLGSIPSGKSKRTMQDGVLGPPGEGTTRVHTTWPTEG